MFFVVLSTANVQGCFLLGSFRKMAGRWASWWLMGSASRIDCASLLEDGTIIQDMVKISDAQGEMEAVLQAWRVHADNFLDPASGITVVTEDGALWLELPREAEALAWLQERLQEETQTPASPIKGHVTEGLEPCTVFGLLCVALALVRGSVAPLALAASTRCAASLLSTLVACDRRWGETQQSFAAWQDELKDRAVGLEDLPLRTAFTQ